MYNEIYFKTANSYLIIVSHYYIRKEVKYSSIQEIVGNCRIESENFTKFKDEIHY